MPSSWLQGQKSALPVATIKEEVKTLMKSIVTEMSSPQTQNLSEKQVTMKILSVARGLRMLKKSDILSLYQLLKSEFSSDEVHKTTVRKLFYDVVLMAGKVILLVKIFRESIGDLIHLILFLTNRYT